MHEKGIKRLVSGSFFMGPALLIFTGIIILPILMSMYYSLFQWDGISEKIFIAFDNYSRLMHDPVLWISLKNSIWLTLGALLIQLPVGLMFAIILGYKLKGSNFFKSIYFTPVMLSTAVLGILWGQIYDPNFGLLNNVLISLGLEQWTHAWLGEESTALLSVIAVVAWQYIGFYIIVYVGALQGISDEVLEAARVEGASEWRIIFSIQIPLIWPTITFTVLNCVINSLKYFDLIYIMTGGGPNNASEVLASYMMRNAFRLMDYGYGSTISTFLLLFGLALAFIISKGLGQGNKKFQ
ncbi:putative ABC transporter permease protein YurN [Paenibacillus montaniterrae]|uniref:ABC transporter permease protein YurN n=1 Tax=Paenibacillus montaniterrae TaxID=429341 RepID=A0A919YPI9_9BACL|nr:sugar ABC transporter permease [Paenibacillus montaniterrae]GIP15931.1 putative ABC transporter permease protein YurN [Paenibacillus montaniterrae]